jgi:PAS domain-containing protein
VLTHVLLGEGNKQIASSLGITEQAIKEHVSTMLDKFNVPNRAALAEAGMRLDFSGEMGFDRSWMRGIFLDAQPQICIARGAEFRYEAANEAFMEAVGRRPVIGRTMRETFPELEGQGVFETAERVYATGVPVIEHEVARSWDRGNGIETRLIDLVIQPLHDADGKVNGVASFAVDVTDLVAERRRAELVPQELSAVLDQVPSGVIVVDERGLLVRINEAGRRITRVPLQEHQSFDEQARQFELLDIEGRPMPADERPIARALRGDTVAAMPLTFVVGDPPERVRVSCSVRTLRDSGGHIRGALLVFTELGGHSA